MIGKRRIGLIVLSIAVLGLTTVGCVNLQQGRCNYDDYDPDSTMEAAILAEEELEGYIRQELEFTGRGEQIPALLARTQEATDPLPCVIFLYGVGQEMNFMNEITAPFIEAGFVLVCFEQYGQGEREEEKLNLLEELITLRRRAILNVIETRRLIDYLQTRPDIDPDRIYLIGASFGAITGCPAAAFDDRIKAAVLTYGGGDLSLLASGQAVSEALGFGLRFVKPILILAFNKVDPIRYVGMVSPRPILFQNGTNDPLISAAAAQALFDAAHKPKQIIWYESGHVGEDPKLVKRILDDAITWLKWQDAEMR